MNRQRRKRWY